MSDWDYRYNQPVATDTVSQRSTATESDVYVVCDNCGEDLNIGEDAVHLFMGVIGRGPKSGRPMVVESSAHEGASANLHLWCIAEFSGNNIYEDQFVKELEEERLCSACENKLEGDD